MDNATMWATVAGTTTGWLIAMVVFTVVMIRNLNKAHREEVKRLEARVNGRYWEGQKDLAGNMEAWAALGHDPLKMANVVLRKH